MAAMSRIERVAVYVVVFLSGALLMALEIAAFRIIGKTFGSALRETTAVIAVFLAAMSIGYWAGGRAGDRWPRPGTLVAVLLGAAAVLLTVPWLDALFSPRIAASRLDLSTHAFTATTLLFALPTVLFATVSPIAVRLFARDAGHSGSTAGSISAVSTVGSIAGSVITAFLLIDQLRSITRTVMVVALCACVTAIILIATTMTFRRSVPAIGVALLLAAPALAFIGSTQIEQSLFTPLPNWRVLFVGDSPYHRVTVTEQGGVLRRLTFASAIQSQMSLRDPNGAGLYYADAVHIARLLRPSVRRVLIIGLGGGTLPKQFTHFYPDTTVDVVDVDPLVVDVARKYFAVRPSERLRIHLSDGRLFLRRSDEKWDLIVIDTYTVNRYGDTIPPHLVTQEFFQEVSRHLSDGGILHFHCAFRGGRLLPALEKTMASVFGSVYVSDGEILASDVALITPKETVLERARVSPAARLPYLTRYINMMQPYGRAAADVPLLTDDYAPVDTLLRR
jgi:spermidine synthase